MRSYAVVSLIAAVALIACPFDCEASTNARAVGLRHMTEKRKYFDSKWAELEAKPMVAMAQSQKIKKGKKYPCKDGKAAGEYPCKGVDLLSLTSHKEQGSSKTFSSDIWGWVDPETQREYAITTHSDGMGVVDVTDPVNPDPLFYMKTPKNVGHSYWRDVKVYQNVAYLVGDSVKKHGVQMFDLTRVRKYNNNPPRTPEQVKPDATYNGVTSAHNIFINEDTGFAYVVGSNTCRGGMHILDLSTPLKPTEAACWGGDGYIHDIQCIVYDGPDKQHTDKEICFAFDEDEYAIVDVSNKRNIKIISRKDYKNHRYVHQGWLTEDRRFMLLDDEGDERYNDRTKTHIFDVSNLDKPVYKGIFESPVSAIDHNLYIKGDLAYASNYASGLRIYDTSKLAKGGTLKETAYFDTYPRYDKGSFDGVWSSYVYLPSGSLLISSIEYGLFVVKMTSDDDQAPTGSPVSGPVPAPKPPGVQCSTVTDETECVANAETSSCEWGKPPGEEAIRCYAPCTKKPLKRRKQCNEKAPLSCEWRKVDPNKKRKKCFEIID